MWEVEEVELLLLKAQCSAHILFTLPLPTNLLLLPFLPSATSTFNRPARSFFYSVNGKE